MDIDTLLRLSYNIPPMFIEGKARVKREAKYLHRIDRLDGNVLELDLERIAV